jgi:hypothetical protein
MKAPEATYWGRRKRCKLLARRRAGLNGRAETYWNSHMSSIREQVRNNSVALISLFIALSSLGYNTWRNERTERNRNIRTATFEILTKLAEFERVVFLAHYDKDRAMGNPRIGWTYVIVIHDLSEVVPGAIEPKASELRAIWNDNWEGLGAMTTPRSIGSR